MNYTRRFYAKPLRPRVYRGRVEWTPQLGRWFRCVVRGASQTGGVYAYAGGLERTMAVHMGRLPNCGGRTTHTTFRL